MWSMSPLMFSAVILAALTDLVSINVKMPIAIFPEVLTYATYLFNVSFGV